MIKSKQDIKNAIEEREKEYNSYNDPECYNTAWCAGYIHAMEEILARWYDLYESQKLAYALEDAQDHLWNFFSKEVCLKDDECDKCVEQAVKDGTVGKIAHRFLDSHDCNVAENDQYYSIIRDMYPDESNTYEYKEISLCKEK